MLSLPKSLWKFYFKYATKGFWGLLIGWIIAQGWNVSEAIWFPYIERWFVALFEYPTSNPALLWSHTISTISLITLLALSFPITLIFSHFYRSHWKPKIRNQISEILTEYTENQSMSFWKNRMSGEIKSQIRYVEDGFEVIRPIFLCFLRIVMMLLSIGLILSVNKYVAFILGGALVFRIIYGAFFLKTMHRTSEKVSETTSFFNGKHIDSLSNFYIVKLFVGAKREERYLKAPRQKQIKASIYSYFIQRLFWGVPDFVCWVFALSATLLMCIWLYARGQMLVSEAVFTLSIFIHVMDSLDYVIESMPEIIEQIFGAKEAYGKLIVPIEITDMENAPNLHVKKGEIKFDHVWFKYENKYILRDLNLIINPHEKVGLVGLSGSGKTTLVSLLMRLYDPAKGAILIDGQNIREITQNSLRHNISVIPQEATLFNRTLGENIAYGKPGATRKEIQKAAKNANAHSFIMETHRKYDSIVGERGVKLSSGQKQRIAIARAFLKNAPILILDEATSALDSETEIAVQEAFEKLSKNRTTIAIAHRLSTLRNMDRIIVLNKGKIVEQGTHRQLLRRGGEYARLWKMQSGGFINDSIA